MTNEWKIREIDKASLRDHAHLKENDLCWFFLEYTPGGGYQHSVANSFISNLKKPVSKRNRPDEYRHKTDAIRKAGDEIAGILEDIVDEIILVPVPPSKKKSDREYDDRMLQVLKRLEKKSKEDGHKPMFSELVEQIESMDAAHMSDTRPRIDELVENYTINQSELKEVRKSGRKIIAVFDDVLTAGTHFKAMQKIIESEPSLPSAAFGFFIARCIRGQPA